MQKKWFEIHDKRFLMILLCGILFINIVYAGQTGQDTLRLDWETAWQLAQDKNEGQKLAENEYNKARYQVKEAYSYAMPTIAFNSYFNHYFEIPSVIFNLPSMGGAPAMRIKTQMAQENNIGADISLTQPVWLAGKVGIALKVAQEYAQISKMGIQVSKEDLKVALLQGFYGTIIAEEYLSVSRDALAQAQRYQEQVEDMFEQGIVSEYDLIRAKVAVSNYIPMISQAEAGRDLALKGLKNMIGMDVDKPIRVSGDLDMAMTIPELEYEQATDYALDKRLEVKQLELQKRLFGYQKKVEKRNWLWPNLLVGLKWETMAQRDNMEISKYEFLSGFSGQVILNIPLFDGFASKNRAQIAQVNMRNVDLQISQAKRGIQLQVFQTLRTYQRSEEELVAAFENLEQAQKGYSIAETRYSGGIGTQLEVLDAQIQLNQSKVNLLQAKFNKLVAVAGYERAIGKGFTH